MGFGTSLGRLLLTLFLVIRGYQHIQSPDTWKTKFAQTYEGFYNTTTQIPYVSQNVPSEYLSQVGPKAIRPLVEKYGQYIGYTEILSGVCVFLSIPLLPLISATLLLIETLVFYNPLKGGNLGASLYYIIITVGIVGLIYMMSFSAPSSGKSQRREKEHRHEKHERREKVEESSRTKKSKRN